MVQRERARTVSGTPGHLPGKKHRHPHHVARATHHTLVNTQNTQRPNGQQPIIISNSIDYSDGRRAGR